MPRVKVKNSSSNQDLIGNNFNNNASESVFTLGKFSVDSNFSGRKTRNYNNTISSFVKPITLETMAYDDEISENVLNISNNATLNFDKSDLKKYVRFGSTREILRVTIQNIIKEFPASVFVNSQLLVGGNVTIFAYNYNVETNTSQFNVPSEYMNNIFGFVFNEGNTNIPNNNELKNLNLSYEEYVIWEKTDPDNNENNIIGFSGDSQTRNYVTIIANGDVFPNLTVDGAEIGSIDFHIKPKPAIYNRFKTTLGQLEKYFLEVRSENNIGYDVIFKEPLITEEGNIEYAEKMFTWGTSDGYNVDVSGSNYSKFLENILNAGSAYDSAKTDLVARFLMPESLIKYDFTDEKKSTKLMRIYGREFDQLFQFIDSLVNINKTTYSKKNDMPDQIVKNFAKTLGWDVFTILKEDELVESLFNNDKEDSIEDLTPSEIDIELWRRIIINTNYYWKTKGTRDAIKSIFKLIGIPDQFINITEYVYTVDGKIDPNSVELSLEDLPSSSLPYNSDGYPIAPIEDKDFYFQLSGNTDGGQAYFNVFRQVGFNLNRTVDNKKSWVETGEIERVHNTTPNYFQADSKLVLNTKEVDVSLDIARGVEYDVYEYIKNVDYPANSSGYTQPYTFINISAGYSGSENTFTLAHDPIGDVEVNFNGINLSAPIKFESSGETDPYFNRLDNTLSPNSRPVRIGDKLYYLAQGTGSNWKISTYDLVSETWDYVYTEFDLSEPGKPTILSSAFLVSDGTTLYILWKFNNISATIGVQEINSTTGSLIGSSVQKNGALYQSFGTTSFNYNGRVYFAQLNGSTYSASYSNIDLLNEYSFTNGISEGGYNNRILGIYGDDVYYIKYHKTDANVPREIYIKNIITNNVTQITSFNNVKFKFISSFSLVGNEIYFSAIPTLSTDKTSYLLKYIPATDTWVEYEIEFDDLQGAKIPINSISHIYNNELVLIKRQHSAQYIQYNFDIGTSSFNYLGIISSDFVNDGMGDYSVSGNIVTILNGNYAVNNGSRRDVVTISYLYNKLGIILTGQTSYLITRVTPNAGGTLIPLPNKPSGAVQLTLNGISLTHGTSLFVGDYIQDPNNTQQLVVQNVTLTNYLARNPIIQVAYVVDDPDVNIEKKAEFHRVDSFSSSKFYSNNSINKYIYRLNHKILDVENVKFFVNGMAIEPGTDYQINPSNQYEILLPQHIKLGDMLSAYYLIQTDDSTNKPVVNDDFGVGDISNMSFLEFLELLQRRMINVRNRKVITDNDTGYYPTLYNAYSQYLVRGNLADDDPLKSNGYTFRDLYPFFKKYNAFFQRFVDQLLPATIILKKGGILIRNTTFTKQKFTYRRGVNFDQTLNYLGDDGSTFKIKQNL